MASFKWWATAGVEKIIFILWAIIESPEGVLNPISHLTFFQDPSPGNTFIRNPSRVINITVNKKVIYELNKQI